MGTKAASIIILNHNGREHLAPCLGSLRADGWPSPDVEVILVDNGSTDGSRELVRTDFNDVEVVDAGANLGFAHGNAVGLERSRGQSIVFLNNDTRVERGWLTALVSALERAPSDVAAVTGRITSWDGRRIDFRDALVTFDGHAFQRDHGRPTESVRDDPPGTERIIACGGNMAVRRKVFTEAGGFDDDFFAYLEDVDLGLRLRTRGYRIVYEPRAVVGHRSGATGEALGIYNRGFLIEKNAFAVLYKNFDDEYLRAWLPAALLTFLHRTERIVREKAEAGERIAVDPYVSREREGLVGDGLRDRLGRGDWRRAIVRAVEILLRLPLPAPKSVPVALVADPHTLSQLRALHRIMAGIDALHAKRRENESARRISSRELFARWPLAIVPTYPGDAELFDSGAFRSILPEGIPFVQMGLRDVIG